MSSYGPARLLLVVSLLILCSAFPVETAKRLAIEPGGRSISGSYTDGADCSYVWEIVALPPK